LAAVAVLGCGRSDDKNAKTTESAGAVVSKDVVSRTPGTVKIEASKGLLAVVEKWDTNIWFFTSRNEPLRSLDGLTKDQIACWGGELCDRILQFREALGIPTDQHNQGVYVIGVGVHSKFEELKPYGLNEPVRLFVTWSQFASDLDGAVRVEFIEKR